MSWMPEKSIGFLSILAGYFFRNNGHDTALNPRTPVLLLVAYWLPGNVSTPLHTMNYFSPCFR